MSTEPTTTEKRATGVEDRDRTSERVRDAMEDVGMDVDALERINERDGPAAPVATALLEAVA